MPIPAEILAVPRPKSTRVKKSGDRYLVIKRTSKYVDGRAVPVELGTIGEIINGEYVEIRKEPKRKSSHIDIKDYGEVALFDKVSHELYKELAEVFDASTAKRLYVIALLRCAYPDIKDRDLKFFYDSSFMSEMYPGVHLSENTVSDFLQKTGMEYRKIHEFMENRIQQASGKTLVVDGMLKDNNSITNMFSEYSRKGAKKGSKDVSLTYVYDPETKEPIAVYPQPGNMLDLSAIQGFVEEYSIKNCLLVLDKGYYSQENMNRLRRIEGLSYIIPMKASSRKIRDNGLDTPYASVLKGYKEETVLYKKVRVSDDCYLYGFRDPKTAYEQEVGYIEYGQKKGTYDEDKFLGKKNSFGLIVFESRSDLEPLEVYRAYVGRWEIEVMFDMFKNIVDLDTVNVHGDYRLYATEFINYLSVIMSTRVRRLLCSTMLPGREKNKQKYIAEIYSTRQLLHYLSKVKRVCIGDSQKWLPNHLVNYVADLVKTLNL